MADQKKFASKELHFLKSDSKSGIHSVCPPSQYFSDFLFSTNSPFTTFESRLQDFPTKDHSAVCAVVKLELPAEDDRIDEIDTVFENLFNSMLDNKKGIWERILNNAFALFFLYDGTKNGLDILTGLKTKLSGALKTKIAAGVGLFPFMDASLIDTCHNAVKALDHAAFFGPDSLKVFDAVSLNISGDRLYHLGNCQEAIREYEKGLVLDKTNINLLNSLGVCYGIMNQLAEAREQFKKALAINPEELIVIYNTGLIHSIDNSNEKAVAYLKKAHAIDEDVFEVELLLGSLLFKKQQYQMALPHLKTACRLNPNAGIPHKLKGEIYLEQNRPEKAFNAFTKAIKCNPEDADSLSGAACSLELQNKNMTIALTFARKSVALDPDKTLFRERLELIQSKIDPDPLQASGY